jgi:hypothetical protein
MRILAGVLMVVLIAACAGPAAPTDQPPSFFLRVQDINGPPVTIVINGTVVGATYCDDPAVRQYEPGASGVPALPWTVDLRTAAGTVLQSLSLDGSESHILQVLQDRAYLDGPTPNPGMVLRRPCPSLYFATASPS